MAKDVTSLPMIAGNFVPLPEVLLDLLISGQLSRQELLVTLYLGRVSYALGSERSFLGLDAIAQATLLPATEAEEALARAIERGTVLEFKTEGPGRFYLLNTDENRRITGVLTDPGRARTAAAAPERSSPPATSTPAAGIHAPIARSVSRRVLERIVGVVGRELTRDETERLTDLGAPEEFLLKAVDNLIAKNVEVYSSDLVIYEYESIASAEKRKADDVRKREAAEQAKVKSRACKRCAGLGYIFTGVNTIKECDCRKTA
jgi:hypothetical protein